MHNENQVSVLSFGGGVNSTALLIHLHSVGKSPTLVLFSDTGGELPATYKHLTEMQQWARARGIAFERVSNAGRGQGETLEENCLMRKELPSLAYGFKGCSTKWKRQPMDRYIREWQPAKDAWARGEKVIRYIGIDAGENHRAVLTEDKKFTFKYPLVEIGAARAECIEIISKAGIEVPPKSSCFFCPAMKKPEILAMQKNHPDLMKRALAIESNAVTHTVKGLGRRWSWSDFLKQEMPSSFFPNTMEAPCGCMDESNEDD